MPTYVRNIAIFLVAILIMPMAVQAESLSKKQCSSLKLRKQKLAKAGAVKNMARGAAWAKKNLTPKALQDVKSLIGVSEQLLFRCGHRSMRYVDLRSKPLPSKKTKSKGKNGKKQIKTQKQTKKTPQKQSQNQSHQPQRHDGLASFLTRNPDEKTAKGQSAEEILGLIGNQ